MRNQRAGALLAPLVLAAITVSGCRASTPPGELGRALLVDGESLLVPQTVNSEVGPSLEEQLTSPESASSHIQSRVVRLISVNTRKGSVSITRANGGVHLAPLGAATWPIPVRTQIGISIWDASLLKQQLVREAGVDCSGELRADENGDNSVYFVCDDARRLYRWEPEMRAICEIEIDRRAVPDTLQLRDAAFSSSSDGKTVFLSWSGSIRGSVDGCEFKIGARVKTEGKIIGLVSSRDGLRLIGTNPQVRIYQSAETEKSQFILLQREGDADIQRLDLPRDFEFVLGFPLGRYLRRSNQVVWRGDAVGDEKSRFFFLDLETLRFLESDSPNDLL